MIRAVRDNIKKPAAARSAICQLTKDPRCAPFSGVRPIRWEMGGCESLSGW